MVWLRREGHAPTRADEETSKTGPLLDRMRQTGHVGSRRASPVLRATHRKAICQRGGRVGRRYELLEYLLERLADREWASCAVFGCLRHPPEDAFISRNRWAELTSWAQSSGWDLPLQVFSKWRARRSLDASTANADIRGACRSSDASMVPPGCTNIGAVRLRPPLRHNPHAEDRGGVAQPAWLRGIASICRISTKLIAPAVSAPQTIRIVYAG